VIASHVKELRQINPELYEAECRRMQARFEEAVELAEQAKTFVHYP